MPSEALLKFERDMLRDVDRLIALHGQLSRRANGRRGLGHITRSGLVMLCAAWELYVEDVLVEVVGFLVNRCDSPKELPKPMQKTIAKFVKDHIHELKPLELAGNGWEDICRNLSVDRTRTLNTPKSEQIDKLFKDMTGLPEVSASWQCGKGCINGFVSDRGEVAHQGAKATYIRIANLKAHLEVVKNTAVEMDNALADHIQNSTLGGTPWRRRRAGL